MNPSQLKRFEAKIRRNGMGCLEWTASRMTNGYGKFRINGKSPQLAHRLAYEHVYGPIPKGLQIDHICCNRACVRPDHLRAVTPRENILAPWSKSPSKACSQKTHCPKGHPYSGRNLILRKRGSRECRECSNASNRLRWLVRREKMNHVR